jgi:glutamate-1-semialdehyde 2,1-aminomutase
MNRSEQLFHRAQQLLPGGVNSPVRAFRGVGGTPRFIASANGCHFTDVDGQTYIDYVGSWGPMILGHAPPPLIEHLSRIMARGTTFGLASPLEVELAREIVRRVPSVERVRMVNSGTEAVMSAIRLARAATKRDKIIKFDGCYHGHADSMLVRAGSGVATLGLPDSPGVTEGAARDTLTATYNDAGSVERLFDQHRDQIAAIIVEPVAGNMGVAPPAAGFLPSLRDLATRNEALLIFDEVMTGFRVARGGAQELYGIAPDLTTFGKIIGGGFPVGAYGGRADLMNLIAPSGPVYQAGTLSGNPVAMAAGLYTLTRLDSAAYETLERRSATLQRGLEAAIEETRAPAVVQRVGSMLTLIFTTRTVNNFGDASACDHARFARFFHAMLARGVHLPPSGYEAWFVSLAHNDEVIDQTINTARTAFVQSMTDQPPSHQDTK